MLKKWVAFVTALTFMFTAFSLAADVDAKGYKSGRKSFSPSSGQTVNKQQDSTVQAKKTAPESKPAVQPAKKKSSAGSFFKGLLLGGLLMGLFTGFGPLAPILAFVCNTLLLIGIVMMGRAVYKHYKHKKKRERETAWRA
ncbi:hypothetical protein [Ectobacillus ponti]|uniref:Preprotein translocase subunit Tim44 n=1 Tax=Ectobacillus ponti TaxID=2961894 RepID=A0AA41XER6_9BACI|nr:hypothetical protein [Ectobacillus ponti]MCP8970756.1 hypothetical protein [Ectobacillus ponti]